MSIDRIEIAFDEPVDFSAAAVTLRTATFPGGVETLGQPWTDAVVSGSGTSVMTVDLRQAIDNQTWLKVTLDATAVTDVDGGNALDGEPSPSGTGLGYIRDDDLDLPSGDGVPGGGAAFYIGRLVGELDGDGVVDFDDLGISLANWGGPDPPRTPDQGDFNNDQMVDFDDIGILLANWDNTIDALPGGGAQAMGAPARVVLEADPLVVTAALRTVSESAAAGSISADVYRAVVDDLLSRLDGEFLPAEALVDPLAIDLARLAA